jgi:hypothetical protein
MKKLISLSLMLIAMLSCSKEKYNIESDNFISTDFGIKKVTQNQNGFPIIIFTKKEWEELKTYLTIEKHSNISNISNEIISSQMQEYNIDPYLKEVGVKVKWKIGAKKYNCKKGIGFKCGGSIGGYAKVGVKEANSSSTTVYNTQTTPNGRNVDRMYLCRIIERKGEIHFEFLEPVDWDWLEANETN